VRKVRMVVGLGLMFALPLWAGDAATGTPLAAVWKENHIDFLYVGRTARYSCEGLRDKMRALLLDLGARRDLKVSVVGCDESGQALTRGSIGPRLDIVFSSPALPDAAAKPLHPGDLAVVEARFEPFTLTSDAFRNYGIGDCELIEEFTRQILPKLATRDVKRDIACVPNQLTGSRFFVHGEVLKAASNPSG
jgi:hypothetical protein